MCDKCAKFRLNCVECTCTLDKTAACVEKLGACVTTPKCVVGQASSSEEVEEPVNDGIGDEEIDILIGNEVLVEKNPQKSNGKEEEEEEEENN